MALGNSGTRRLGYLALALFSLALLGLAATRINRTLRANFYDRVVAELIAAAAVTFLWSLFALHSIHNLREGAFASTFRSEVVSGSIPWILLLVGAAYATSRLEVLTHCSTFECRLLSALLAFAWITWGTLTLLLLTAMMYAIAHRGWDEPMHARWITSRTGGHYRDSKTPMVTEPRV
ncbi:hypothetical protein AAF712_015473 [Marasmius tenuissimus]|uniref:MARVEL domain-containing protein n=1 Tax=Marasmius tenuissimus TaxID=585030 RepID=A0ABR2Z8F2_9AGAR